LTPVKAGSIWATAAIKGSVYAVDGVDEMAVTADRTEKRRID
jgi:hypothetical protein